MKNQEVVKDYSTVAEKIVKDSILVSFLKEIKNTFILFFGKQEDNEFLRDLGIKKGIWSGIKYSFWLFFILPLKIINFIIRPDWKVIDFVERNMITPVMEMSFVSGEKSPSLILGETYEKYLNFLISTEKVQASSMIKPQTDSIEKVVNYAKIRSLITIGLFSVLMFVFTEAVIEFADFIGSLGWLGVFSSYLSISADSMIFAIIMFSFKAAIYAFFAYLYMSILSLIIEGVKNLIYARRELVIRFIDDTMSYAVQKSIENFGEDKALKAYDLLISNYVVEKEDYRENITPPSEKLQRNKEYKDVTKIENIKEVE